MSGERTECLFFAGCNVTKHTNVFREDIFTGTDDGHRSLLEISQRPSSVGRLIRNVVFLEFAENVANLQALLQAIVLIGIDELEILAAVEDNRMILVIRLAIAEDRMAWKLDTELRLTLAIVVIELTVPIYQS